MTRSLSPIIISLLLLFVCTAATKAQVTDSTIIRLMQAKNIPVLGLGFIDNGQVASAKVYGELSPGVPAPANTVFNVASITKTVTTMITLCLVNSGKWDLDEPIFHYWTDPDVANDLNSKKLTTRHILTHRTGFPNWRWMTPSKKLAFEFEPGFKFQYSGEGMEYLRHALENKFHRSLEQLADSLIFAPLQMNDTHFTWRDDMAHHFAVAHNSKGGALEIIKNNEASAADQLKTTVADYNKFLVWMTKGAGLSKSIYQQMISPLSRIQENKFMGLGWAVYPEIDGEIGLSHSGIDPGVNTIAFVLPNSRRALLIFTNSDNGPQIYSDLVKIFLKEQGDAIIATEMKH